MKRIKIILTFFLIAVSIVGQKSSHLRFSTDFEGGNGFIEKISNDTIWITPDTRNIVGDWFYWAIDITSSIDQCFVLCLPPYKIPAFGAAYSIDCGENWDWLKTEETKYMESFKMCFCANKTVRLSMGFTYTGSNWKKFIKNLDTNKFITDTLCMSSNNEAVPMILFKDKENTSILKPKIVITARHHACEMMANYVLEGIIKSLISKEKQNPILEKYDILIIPFVDYDGVQNGDQGKNRFPRDHNRDYSGESIYTTTKAIREYITSWAQGNLILVLDLHCPGIWGREHELLHIVGSKSKKYAEAETSFASYLARHTQDKELVFDETSILKFGVSWNNDKSQIQGDSFTAWIQKEFPNSRLSCSVEIPYATNKGQKITIENLNEFGGAMLHAIMDFLNNTKPVLKNNYVTFEKQNP